MKKIIETKFSDFISEKFNSEKYTSFSKLTKKDLYDIAKADPLGELEFSGVWDEVGEGNYKQAYNSLAESFESFLDEPFPQGFKNIPKTVPIYRFVTLENESKLNREHLGNSWFADLKLDSGFFDKLDYLTSEHRGKPTGHNLYLISATIPESNINIPYTLWLRDVTWAENEIHIKNDSDKFVKIISIEKGMGKTITK